MEQDKDQLTREEADVIMSFNGRTTFEELCGKTGLPEDRIEAILHRLIAKGLVVDTTPTE